MNRGFAATVAVPAWAQFMIQATAGDKPDWFKAPPDVERTSVCRISGLRAAPACKLAYAEDGQPNVYEDYYLAGTGPHEICTGEHSAPAPLEVMATGAGYPATTATSMIAASAASVVPAPAVLAAPGTPSPVTDGSPVSAPAAPQRKGNLFKRALSALF